MKIHQIQNHQFGATILKQPTFCCNCSKFIYGLGKQGYQCKNCQMVVHKKCHNLVQVKCLKSQQLQQQQQSIDQESDDLNETNQSSHRFLAKTFTKPTFCQHCGTLLYGLIKQGLKCQDCGIIVHKRCQENLSKINCQELQQQQHQQ